jgi:uracil-DNA glycosylase
VTQPLLAALKQHLAEWQDDLAPAWHPYLEKVELDWPKVVPAALLKSSERIIPLRKGHGDPDAPVGSHVLRAFDGVAPEQVRAVLLGQDPYPKITQATGVAFEPGGVEHWDTDTPSSLRHVVPVLARHRRPNAAQPALNDWPAWRSALQQDLSWIGTPEALFSHWQREGILCLNIGLTLSRKDKTGQGADRPAIQPIHMALWAPLVKGVLHVLTARAQPLVLMLWGEGAMEAVLNARLPSEPSRILEVKRPHPTARTPKGGLPPRPFLKCPNPFDEANEKLTGAGHPPISW